MCGLYYIRSTSMQMKNGKDGKDYLIQSQGRNIYPYMPIKKGASFEMFIEGATHLHKDSLRSWRRTTARKILEYLLH